MEKKFNIVVGEDGTVKLPDEVLEKLEVKPGEEVRFEVDDNFYAVRLLSRVEAERLSFASHSVTATVSNNRNSSRDGTYLRSLLLLLIVLLIFCFLILPQRTDCRTGAKPHSNA